MALWGNRDLVGNGGTIEIDLSNETITGTGTTFSTSGYEVSEGDVIVVGAGATYGYAVISSVTSNTVASVATTQYLIPHPTTGIITAASYYITQRPISSLENVVYKAPQAKTTGFSTSPVTTDVRGVNVYEVGGASITPYAVAHSGWVGIMTYIDAAGNLRVKHEVLVAGGITTTFATDSADDAVFPDYLIQISTQPSNRSGILTTANTTFSVVAFATPDNVPLAYQWQSSTDNKTWSDLSASTVYSDVNTATVGIASTTVTGDRPNNYYFRVGVSTTSAQTVFSNSARLTYV